MPSKRPSPRRPTSPAPADSADRRARSLLALTLFPLVLGLVLISAALVGISLWDAWVTQAMVGGLFVLVSFAASNALQKKWNLAAGWLLVGAAAGFGFSLAQTWATVVAFVLGGVGLYLLLTEFIKRGWERQRRSRKK